MHDPARNVPPRYLCLDGLLPVEVCESCRGVLLEGERIVCRECCDAAVGDHAHVLFSMFGGRVVAAVLTAGLLTWGQWTTPTAAWAQSGDSSWAATVARHAAQQDARQGGGSPTLAPTPTPVYVPLRFVVENDGGERNQAV